MSSSRSWRLLGCVLLLAVPWLRAAAQDRIFPNVQSFELPEASPRVHGLVGRIFSARRGDSQFGRESEAEVAVGGWRARERRGGRRGGGGGGRGGGRVQRGRRGVDAGGRGRGAELRGGG